MNHTTSLGHPAVLGERKARQGGSMPKTTPKKSNAKTTSNGDEATLVLTVYDGARQPIQGKDFLIRILDGFQNKLFGDEKTAPTTVPSHPHAIVRWQGGANRETDHLAQAYNGLFVRGTTEQHMIELLADEEKSYRAPYYRDHVEPRIDEVHPIAGCLKARKESRVCRRDASGNRSISLPPT